MRTIIMKLAHKAIKALQNEGSDKFHFKLSLGFQTGFILTTSISFHSSGVSERMTFVYRLPL